MKILIASLLLLILPEAIQLPTPLFLSNKVPVQGKVIDSDTQQPLVGATVSIKEGNEHKTTDSEGNFELYVKPGNYTLEVYHTGFKKSSKKIQVPNSGLSNLVISLDPSDVALEELVLSDKATSSQRSLSGAVISISPMNAPPSHKNNSETPVDEHPFSVNTEVGAALWNPKHQLVQIGIQGEKIEADNLPSSNLVFLLDVSGSMNSYNKLPLLKKGFKLLTNQLREEDFVSIVVYAGNSGLVLPPTSGADKETILEALDKLNAGGSTAGAAGIKQAYQVAKEHFKEDGNNRVILATDGDFNVGVSSNSELVKLIGEKRDEGIFLSVLGFGSGNLKDSKMEQIADNGNGNYYYIDNLLEAKKVLVSEMGGTLHTIAKDVKIQVEFNPENVKAYRLIGYENRLLADEDFNDDQKDAGELGSGHTVTALYEVIPHGVDIDSSLSDIDPLKYQTPAIPVNGFGEELMTVKLRYKKPTGDKSALITRIIEQSENTELSENLRFAASVALFGMVLRDSKFKGNSSFSMAERLARSSKGVDENGYRAEFIKIIELAELLYDGEASN